MLRSFLFRVCLTIAGCGGAGISTHAWSTVAPLDIGTPVTAQPGGHAGIAAAGKAALGASAYAVAQSAGKVIISVTRSGGSSGAASVRYATHDGTAVAGGTYAAAAGTVLWAANEHTTKTFAVSLSATPFTGTRNFTVALSNAGGAALGSPSSAMVTITPGSSVGAGRGPAAKLAAKLGRASRLLVGLGGQPGTSNAIATIQSQALKVDIYERYLGTGDWTSWNSPPCDYVCMVAVAADSIGALPMYTQYQMANNGDGNLAVLNDSAFMNTYWARLKLLFQDLGAYNKPALVNIEPDFWGYTEKASPGGDPTRLTAIVSTNSDCATLHNDVAGLAGCIIAMARKYAPKSFIGFSPSSWGGADNAAVIAFMNAVGVQKTDFIVQQTIDRDAGCFEVSPQPSDCSRRGTGWYWDESNIKHPNFHDHLAQVQAYHAGMGNLPVIWWQTPEGVPSRMPGGTANHYRDNRVHYFLSHPAELTAVGGLGVVFGAGDSRGTSIVTDGGQFQGLDGAYMAAPAPLP